MLRTRRFRNASLLVVGIGSLVASTSAQRASPTLMPSPAPAEGITLKRSAPGFTPGQIENMEARMATAQAIVDQLQPAAKAAGTAAGWRQATLESLLLMSLPQLEAVRGHAHDQQSLARATAAAMEDPSLIGDPSQDLVYTPMTPCRYIDTRNVGGPITAAAPRGFDLALTGASYGGAGACSVTEQVVAAIAMNVTITQPVAAPGFLAVKPSLAAPLTSFMNWYEAGPLVQVANAGVASVSQPGAPDEFIIQVAESTHVIVDFFGVFQSPQATALQTTSPASPPTNVPAQSFGGAVSPSCPFGYSVTGGGCQASSAALLLVSSFKTSEQWLCSYNNTSTMPLPVIATVHCARIPGR